MDKSQTNAFAGEAARAASGAVQQAEGPPAAGVPPAGADSRKRSHDGTQAPGASGLSVTSHAVVPEPLL